MGAANRGRGAAAAWLQAHASHIGEECLIWPFGRNTQRGYGMLGYNGHHLYAHRVMCELAHGPAPAGKPQASHTCGNGHLGCVNPRHLLWKSNSENQLDRRKHGTVILRRNRLDARQVQAARLLKGKMTIEEIAAMFGVKRGCIEYWHRHNGPLQRPSHSRGRIYQIQKRATHEQSGDRKNG